MFKIGFVMEQTLGHVTHHKNLARWVDEDTSVSPTWAPIEYSRDDRWERMPVVRGNWSLKASLRARDAIRNAMANDALDALFFHTQTTALFAPSIMRRVPSVVSLDATPLNYDTVGAEYSHNTGNNRWLERRKYLWNRRTFDASAALVTWCQWAKDSLVRDYGTSADKVTVIPPGVDMEQWSFERETRPASARPLRLLFVGADFERKGGDDLVEAFRSGLNRSCEMDIVTKDGNVAERLSGTDGLRVHTGMTANCEPLRALFRDADLFVFPTRGDCLPIAVMEAMAAGLPIVATGVGAMREEVFDGRNGLIVPPRDPAAVAVAVQSLASDRTRLAAMGEESRRLAEERFDARCNYNRVLSVIKRCVSSANGAAAQ